MEAQFLEWLRQRLPIPAGHSLGLTDDAALLPIARNDQPPADGQLVVTTDLVSDGVDFRIAEIDPRRAGRKALAINLSDLAAMAAQPLAVVMAVAMPSTIAGEAATKLGQDLYEGMLALADQFEVPIVGGDTNTHDGPLVMCGTALGQVSERGPLVRGGGRPSDRLLVTGVLGGSIAGHHLDFTPRIQEALLLHQRYELHAGMDISDGLALDTSRLATASGCGAVLEPDRLPISPIAGQSDDPRGHALSDGEDFELLLAVPPAEAERLLADQPVECGVTEVGRLIAEPGLWRRDADGTSSELPAAGWLHG